MKLLLLILISFICFNSFATDEMGGTWNFLEVINSSYPEAGLKPFPENIIIEFTGEDEGKLTIKLPAQSEPKSYLFSKTLVKTSTTFQTYYPETDKKYSLKEEATISYSEGVLNVQLTWTQPTCEERKEILQDIPENSVCMEVRIGTDTTQPIIATGSYIFTLNGEYLHFERTNDHKSQNIKTAFSANYSLQE